MIGKNLQQALGMAVHEVRKRRHEYLTLEHLLFGIVMERSGRKIIAACGGNVEKILVDLNLFFVRYMETVEEVSETIYQTLAVQRVMDNAVSHLRRAGKGEADLDVGDVLASLLEEKDSYAAECLKKQGIKRIDLLNYLSHGKDEQPSPKEERQTGKDPLQAFTRDLTRAAQDGELDPLVGREMEIARSIEILARRRKNNPLYVGEPGTGKTAIAEGLAQRFVRGNVPDEFCDARIFSLDLGAVLAGSKFRGDFESRIKAVVKALEKIPKAILFIDEIHTLVGAGATSGGTMDAANLLKPILADGKIRCMGSTTHDEYRNHFEKDRALARRFQKVDVAEPSQEECVEILKGLQDRYEGHHKVHFSPSAIRAAVSLSSRYIQDRFLPDKAIDVMDEAGAYVHLRPGTKPGALVTRQDVERIVARMAGIPAQNVTGKERDRLKKLGEDLRAVIFGQDQAVDMVTRTVLRFRAGLGHSSRPSGSFLFYGPTGVGKTELAKQLAVILGVTFLRFDMSEYMEKHAVARLIGSPPGYVGFEQGGLLTEAVRRTPYAVVLLDEIEKAHPDIQNVLLQIMDYATLTDNTGRKVDFRNVTLIMTSNAGARDMASSPMGFVSGGQNTQDAARRAKKAIDDAFSPEFRNRLDAMVPFNGLSRDLMGRIVDKSVRELEQGLAEKRVTLTLDPAAREWLADRGYDATLGARPLQKVIREQLEDKLAEEVLFGRLTRGGHVVVLPPQAGGNALEFRIGQGNELG